MPTDAGSLDPPFDKSGKAEESLFKTRPDVGISSYALVQRAHAEARKGAWLQRIEQEAVSLSPHAFVGPVAAGEKVVADTRSSVYKFLRTHYNDALAVEMEGRGFLSAAHASQPVMALIVRGISDLIDEKTEAHDDKWQPIAARHAGAFAFEILAKLDVQQAERESSGSELPGSGTEQIERDQRCIDLAANIQETLKLIKQYEEQRRLDNEPRTKARAEREINDLRMQLSAYEEEYAQRKCSDSSLPKGSLSAEGAM